MGKSTALKVLVPQEHLLPAVTGGFQFTHAEIIPRFLTHVRQQIHKESAALGALGRFFAHLLICHADTAVPAPVQGLQGSGKPLHEPAEESNPGHAFAVQNAAPCPPDHFFLSGSRVPA